ncbi:YkoP family protein [Virgibacillus alimentarius]|uniref:YkoP family protein n=1 Tax=Virgibacillus alimentarius TaxID=698769 RepID=UPI0004939FC8|nr:hypothetical protein [Virgibacillus alimentarius]
MKNYLLRMWKTIDPVYFTFTRLQYVPSIEKDNTVFRVRLTHYKGTTVVLRDGTAIETNDLLLKIHLHNVRILRDLQAINGDVKKAVYLYHTIKHALPMLSKYVMEHQSHHEIKGIIGITCLHRGASRLGFEIVPIKNSWYCIYKKLSFLPMNFLCSTMDHNVPVYLFMSKGQLQNKYNG